MFASYRSLLDGRYCTFEIRFFISVEYNEFQCEEIVFKTGNIANMRIYRAIENKWKKKSRWPLIRFSWEHVKI
jgi:hypothetical protein